MNKEKLKLIVKNLKLLVDSLESEVYSDVDSYRNSETFSIRLKGAIIVLTISS